MDDEVRLRLLHGPYHPPAVGIGDWIECEIRGRVRVGAWSEGPIPWPLARRRGKFPYILCGDLVRAVRQESGVAVMHWWGVSEGLVVKWRRELGVETVNEGTRRLFQAWMPEKLTDEVRARTLPIAIRNAHTPQARAKVGPTMRRRGTLPHHRAWTRQEDALLGTMSDPSVAQRTGRSTVTVSRRRHALGIPGWLYTGTPTRPCSPVSAEKIQARRLALGVTQAEVQRRLGSKSCYSHLEAGIRRNVTLETLARLARALECASDDLTASQEVSDPAT